MYQRPTELERMVVRAEQRSMQARVDRYAVLCEHCFQDRGDHAHIGDWCPRAGAVSGPWWEHTRFSPLLCQWEEPETQGGACDSQSCNRPMVVVEIADDGVHGGGCGYCLTHYQKAQAMYAKVNL